MKSEQWAELGLELKALRKARGLTQKAIVDLSGEYVDERRVRAYETGDERPSRYRLLKLLLGSFQLRDVLEINRLLRLAEYASLTPGEMVSYGLRPSSGPTEHGAPTDFKLEARTLIVTDGQGREVFRKEFSSRFGRGAYDGKWSSRCTFADIDADGSIETLFAWIPEDFTSVGTMVFCFAPDGRIKWQFEPGRTVHDTEREYEPPYLVSNVDVLFIPNSGPRVLVSSNHHLHNANQVAILDSAGKLISEYWHSGHLLHMVRGDINGDGVEEILMGGVNNGYYLATLVVFDSRNISGVSSQPYRQIVGLQPGTEKAVMLFPKTCVSKDSKYNRVADVRITKERRIVVVVAEGVSEEKNPGVMIYELDFDLRVLSAGPDSHLQDAHRLFEVQGKLDHSWTQAENERLKEAIFVKGHL